MNQRIVAGIGVSEDVRYLLENFLFDSKYFFEFIDVQNYSPSIFIGENKPYAVFVEEDSLVTDDVKTIGRAKKVPVVVLGNSLPEGKIEDCVFVLNFPIFSVKLLEFLDSLEGRKKEGIRYIETRRKLLKGKRVLIFEDSKLVGGQLADILSEEGADVKIFNTTEDFMEKIKTYSPDIILLDLVIPPHDGYEVLDALKNSEFKHIPVIIISVKSYIDDQKTSLLLGAVEFLPKPFKAEEVRKTLSKVLSKD